MASLLLNFVVTFMKNILYTLGFTMWWYSCFAYIDYVSSNAEIDRNCTLKLYDFVGK